VADCPCLVTDELLTALAWCGRRLNLTLPVHLDRVCINVCRLGASPVGAGLPSCFLEQAGAQPRLRSLYRFTVCKFIAKSSARTARSGSSAFEVLERHGFAGDAAALAGVPAG
jgi:hypothetical protein